MSDKISDDSGPTKPKPASVTVGEYVLGRKLGSGGFGAVYEARHQTTDLPYALKRMLISEQDAERFRKEALYPARIASQSMHVLSVHSFFHDETHGYFYLVTELISDGDLRDFLAREPKPLPVRVAVELALGIARGLAAIHAQGIIHLDLKPRNVLMDRKDGRWVPKIGDFGLARSEGSVSIGDFASPGYAAPEQLDLLSSRGPGPESDLFAFGMVLYELLTGERLTDATELREYKQWLAKRQPPPKPSARRPELAPWPELDALVADLLELDRDLRKASAAEVVKTLARVLRDVERGDVPERSTLPVETQRETHQPERRESAPVTVAPAPKVPAAPDRRPQVPVTTLTTRERWRSTAVLALVFVSTALALAFGAGLLPFLDTQFGGGSIGHYVCALPFGLTVGVVLLGDWRRALTLAIAGIFIYAGVNRLTIWMDSSLPEGFVRSYLPFPIAGSLGAVSMTLAASLWRRELWRILPHALLIGAIGGSAFMTPATFIGGFLGWQVLFGCFMGDYALRAEARLANGRRSREWRPMGYVAAASLTWAASSYGLATWTDLNRPGREAVNPADGLTYRWIPAGRFQMGCSADDNECRPDESPSRSVTLSKGFWIGGTEVTVEAWKKLGRSMPPEPEYGRKLNPEWKNGAMPIVNITWHEAQAYCSAVNGALPTEAQWEYAARAGTTGARYGRLDDIAWYSSNSGTGGASQIPPEPGALFNPLASLKGDSTRTMHEVNRKASNAWGVSDMLGNAWEWVSDDYASTYDYISTTDPDHRSSDSKRYKVLRGGSWYNEASSARASARNSDLDDFRAETLGFRCVWNGP